MSASFYQLSFISFQLSVTFITRVPLIRLQLACLLTAPHKSLYSVNCAINTYRYNTGRKRLHNLHSSAWKSWQQPLAVLNKPHLEFQRIYICSTHHESFIHFHTARQLRLKCYSKSITSGKDINADVYNETPRSWRCLKHSKKLFIC
jgi:hypothetical protein